MLITECTDKSVIKEIKLNPVLFKLHGFTIDPKDFEINPEDRWFLASEGDTKIGLFRFEKFYLDLPNVHISILPEFHRTGKALEAVDAIRTYTREILKIYRIVSTVPIECEHVFRFMQKVGFKPCGVLHNAVFYNNKLQDVIISELEV